MAKTKYQFVEEQGRVVVKPAILSTQPKTKFGNLDAVIKGADRRNDYNNLNDYDVYHATKGKVNRQLGKK